MCRVLSGVLAFSILLLVGLGPRAAVAGPDFLLIEKGRRTLTLYEAGKPIRSYRVALGFQPEGPKQEEGDGRTPEGLYVIDYRNEQSRFHRSLHISYPNESDRRRAEARGVSPGGEIMIHGLPEGWGWLGIFHRELDWTDGCIAVTNEEMDEIWARVSEGTPIEIRP